MTSSTRLVALAAALALSAGLVACNNSPKENPEAQAGETVGDGTTSTADQVREEAAQVGEAIEAGAKEAAQEIDQATDKMAEEAKEAEADTAAEASQDNAGKK